MIFMFFITEYFTNITYVEVKALTKRLEQKMQSLERKAEESRLDMQEEEKELQKEVDIFRGNNLKIESEKVLKEKEVMEIRDEIATIRNQITQVIYFYQRSLYYTPSAVKAICAFSQFRLDHAHRHNE